MARRSLLLAVLAVLGLALVATVLALLRAPKGATSVAQGFANDPASGDVRLEAPDLAPADEREARSLPVEPASPPASSSRATAAEVSRPQVVVLVVDAEGAGLAGATVEVTGEAPTGTYAADARGRAELPLEAGAGSLQLRVSAEGHVPYCVRHSRNEEIRVVLHRATRVRGRVVEAQGRAPVPGARARLEAEGCVSAPRIARADAAGRFEHDGVPLGTAVTWLVEADGFRTALQPLELRDAASEVELALERGLELELEVVDALSGAALAGARVERRPVRIETDVRGRAPASSLVAVGEEQVELSASAQGYCRLHARLGPRQLEAGSVLRLPLLEAARVEGVVQDEGGRPVEGALVYLRYDWGAEFRARRERASPPETHVALPEGWSHIGERTGQEARSDGSGRFAFDGLQPDCASYRVNATLDGFDVVTAEPGALGGPGSTTWVALVLSARPPGAVVTGTLTLNGAPRGGMLQWSGPTRGGWGLVGPEGRFRLEDVEPGSVTLTPHAEGTVSAFWDGCETLILPRTVDVPGSGEVEVALDLVLPLATIAGRVVRADGSPAAGVPLNATSREACFMGHGQSDAEGRFELEVGAEASAYVLVAGRDKDRVVREGVAPGTRDLELVLPGVARLRLRIVDAASGRPLQEFHLLFTDGAGAQEHFDTHMSMGNGMLAPDAQGWYEVELRAGTWDLLVADPARRATSYLPVEVPALVLAPDSVLAPLEVARRKGVELTLQLAPGLEPWPDEGTQVALVETRWWDQVRLDEHGASFGDAYLGRSAHLTRMVRLDAAGRARLVGLEPGLHRFMTYPPTLALEPAEIVVTGHETGPIELRWKEE